MKLVLIYVVLTTVLNKSGKLFPVAAFWLLIFLSLLRLSIEFFIYPIILPGSRSDGRSFMSGYTKT